MGMGSDTETSGSDRKKVILTAECKAPLCDYVAVVEDPDTEYDAVEDLSRHYNEDHDEIDREIAADRYEDWDRDDFEPYQPEESP